MFLCPCTGYPQGVSLPYTGRPMRSIVGAGLAPNTFQIRRFASHTKPIQAGHPERSEGSLSGQRSFAALRMTKRDGLFFEMYCPSRVPCARAALFIPVPPIPTTPGYLVPRTSTGCLDQSRLKG